jgi:hypothetical protein
MMIPHQPVQSAGIIVKGKLSAISKSTVYFAASLKQKLLTSVGNANQFGFQITAAQMLS